ncbi:MAG: class I SAM-dependent methyltransferase [Methanospirillaceae archaeon]|nr:class I SAM-dependent methyltransferase [Methanospirillaceae archaeon]
MDAESKHPILHDTKSIEIAAAFDGMLADSVDTLAQNIRSRRIRSDIVTHIAMRAKKYDEYVQEFLGTFPHGVVVNIGCGFDSRFVRIDNGLVQYYDLDLPEIMAIRSRFFTDSDRYHSIASSILEFSWINAISGHHGPFLFLAEGVFMYLPENDVRDLVRRLTQMFPGSELVCEVVNKKWLSGIYRRIVEFKLQRELHLGLDVTYQSGLAHSNEMEEWDLRIRFLDDWSYLDSYQGRFLWLRVLRHVQFIRYTQWTVHYRLG